MRKVFFICCVSPLLFHGFCLPGFGEEIQEEPEQTEQPDSEEGALPPPVDDAESVVQSESVPPEGVEAPLDAEEEGLWIDQTRNWLYDSSHGVVIWLDQLGGDETEPDWVETPPSHFRIGLLSFVELKPTGKIEFSPVLDFSTDIDLPNLEKRLKLFISTRDPVALEGTDVFQEEQTLRVGASRGFFENWSASAGVKTKWTPEVFTYLQWKRSFGEMPGWTTYPSLKLFWENDERFGASSAYVMNRWKDRRLFRQTFSVKITQDEVDRDKQASEDMDDPQFGDDGGGFRWQSSTIVGSVSQLLDEQDYGRRVGGEDVARGFGLRAQVRGNAVKTLEARTTLYYKRPIHRDYLYLILAPEVIWDEEQSWNEEFLINVGVEMLLWGDDPLL
jgi:hypothetical protein